MNYWKGLRGDCMGKLNMKLMQGIEETENQIKTEKQNKMPQSVPEGTDAGRLQESALGSPNASKQPKARETVKKSKKVENKPDIKPQKQVFSFRAKVSDITIWKAYATAVGKTMENIGVAAMQEYIKRHKLTEVEKAVFEALRAREKKSK